MRSNFVLFSFLFAGQFAVAQVGPDRVGSESCNSKLIAASESLLSVNGHTPNECDRRLEICDVVLAELRKVSDSEYKQQVFYYSGGQAYSSQTNIIFTLLPDCRTTEIQITGDL